MLFVLPLVSVGLAVFSESIGTNPGGVTGLAGRVPPYLPGSGTIGGARIGGVYGRLGSGSLSLRAPGPTRRGAIWHRMETAGGLLVEVLELDSSGSLPLTDPTGTEYVGYPDGQSAKTRQASRESLGIQPPEGMYALGVAPGHDRTRYVVVSPDSGGKFGAVHFSMGGRGPGAGGGVASGLGARAPELPYSWDVPSSVISSWHSGSYFGAIDDVPEHILSKWKFLYDQTVKLLTGDPKSVDPGKKKGYFTIPELFSPFGGPAANMRQKMIDRNAMIADGFQSSDSRVLAAEKAARDFAAQKISDPTKLNALVAGLKVIAVSADPLLRQFPALLKF